MIENGSRNGVYSNLQATADNVARQGAQALQQSGRVAGEALRRTSEVTAEVARHGSEMTAEAVQRGSKATSETVRRNAEVLAEGQRGLAQTATQQFEQVNRKVAEAAQDTAESVRTLMMLPNAANGGLQDLQRGMTGFVEGVMQSNLRAVQGLFQLANPGALIELQQRFVREYVDTVMQGTVVLVRATCHTADEVLRPLEQQIEQRQQAARN